MRASLIFFQLQIARRAYYESNDAVFVLKLETRATFLIERKT